MLYGRGNAIRGEASQRILQVLRDTDLAIREIADRFQCSKSAVAALNRKYKVRDYRGLRNHWTVDSAELRGSS